MYGPKEEVEGLEGAEEERKQKVHNIMVDMVLHLCDDRH
jgi:hypothetical protein